MTAEDLRDACDIAESAGCRVRVIKCSHSRPGSNRRCEVWPGVVGEVVDRVWNEGVYERHVLLKTADVRAYLAKVLP